MAKKIIVAGATGLVGKKLVAMLHKRNIDAVIISRSAEKARRTFPYAQEHLSWSDASPAWVGIFDGATAVINLTGENVGSNRWTEKAMQSFTSSRIDSTRTLTELIRACSNPPVLVNASAVGVYGNTGDTLVNESSAVGSGFLADLCVEWEREAMTVADHTRVVCARIGVVLDGNDGALGKMKTPFAFFIGGALGSGKQWMSWIHIEDVAGMLLWAAENPRVSGALNCVAPSPVTMREFASALGRVLHRPSLFPVPEFVLRLLLGKQHVIVTEGQRVDATKATALGYQFIHPSLEAAMADVLRGKT